MTDAPDGGDEPSGGPAGVASPAAEVHATAWERTIDELRAMQDAHEGKGWETVATGAGQTGAVAPDDGANDWGFVHVVPDGDAGAIAEAVDGGDFPAYDVHRRSVEGRVFAVTSLLDPGTETAVLIAHQFSLQEATELVAHAREVGTVNTLVRYLDGTVVARFEHDEPAKFFPRDPAFEGDVAAATTPSGTDER